MKHKDLEKINIGMMGFGYIAHGVFELISNQKQYIAHKIGKELQIKRIAEKDPGKLRSVPDAALKDIIVSSNAGDVYEDPEIDIAIELIGGVEPAFDFVSRALRSGKYVVTANKDLMANRGGELYRIAEDNNVDILFEASVL